jgi:hypothetical protein
VIPSGFSVKCGVNSLYEEYGRSNENETSLPQHLVAVARSGLKKWRVAQKTQFKIKVFWLALLTPVAKSAD